MEWKLQEKIKGEWHTVADCASLMEATRVYEQKVKDSDNKFKFLQMETKGDYKND